MQNDSGRSRARPAGRESLFVAALLLSLMGCKAGPDFTQPVASVAEQWLESSDPAVHTDRQDYDHWWTAFKDPTLDRLIDLAYRQNLTLMEAGTRVLEARATLGIAIGEFYPQTQQVGANVSYNQASQVDPTSNPQHQLENYWRAALGTQIAWELDLWGKFRRGVESADASYLASIAAYDDVLVTLLGDVATNILASARSSSRSRSPRRTSSSSRRRCRSRAIASTAARPPGSTWPRRRTCSRRRNRQFRN